MASTIPRLSICGPRSESTPHPDFPRSLAKSPICYKTFCSDCDCICISWSRPLALSHTLVHISCSKPLRIPLGLCFLDYQCVRRLRYCIIDLPLTSDFCAFKTRNLAKCIIQTTTSTIVDERFPCSIEVLRVYQHSEIIRADTCAARFSESKDALHRDQ